MDVTVEMVAPCGPDELFGWIEDLGRYPDWLDIVPRAEPAEAHPDDAGPAWTVTLRGQLGPFARAKRLRMVRTAHDRPRTVRFERAEHDGRDHAAWVLTAEVVDNEHARSGEKSGTPGGSRLEMHLHYEGPLGGPPVEKLLADAITRSRPRLLERVTPTSSPGSEQGDSG